MLRLLSQSNYDLTQISQLSGLPRERVVYLVKLLQREGVVRIVNKRLVFSYGLGNGRAKRVGRPKKMTVANGWERVEMTE